MRAAVYHQYGPPEVVRVEQMDRPEPKDNEILVRVEASTVCTADWRIRKAEPSVVRLVNGLLRPFRMKILGMEFAGTVESAGRSVTRFQTGDAVFGGTGFKMGAHAEYVCVAENGSIAKKPARMTFEEAAAVMFGGVSALFFLRKPKIQPGQRVLIYGASGSVGVFGVQLAKQFGAHVTAVTGSANLDWVKALGADEVIDYTKLGDARQGFSKEGAAYDVIFDTVGKSGFSRSMKSLKRGGYYLMAAGPDKGFIRDMAGAVSKSMWTKLAGSAKMATGIVKPAPGDLPFLKELIDAGKLRTVIDRRYRLEEIAEAHRYAEAGHKKGHAVIVIGERSSRN